MTKYGWARSIICGIVCCLLYKTFGRVEWHTIMVFCAMWAMAVLTMLEDKK